MGKVRRIVFRLFFWALFFSPLIIAMLAIEREPLVYANKQPLFDDISDAKNILKRFDPRAMDTNATTTVSVTAGEISMAIGAALSRVGPLRARVDAFADGVVFSGTAELPLPDTFLGRYLNVQATIAESDKELVVSQASIGALPIPSWIIKPVTIYALDWFMGAGKGEETYASIRSLKVEGGIIIVGLKPPANFVADVKAAAGRAIHLGNAAAVRAYYAKVMEVSASAPTSLSRYMGPLFKLAEERSFAGGAIEENRALILALAMYFGDSRFELLLRDVKTGDLDDGGFNEYEVHLEYRHDWVQHFTTTAGIQVAAGSNISNFIGEAKEIKDADGPSGFSFTDIAADRAGVRFAEIATASEASAKRLQRAMAGGASESDFFPKVGDLPEGLSEADFKASYGDISTKRYETMIRLIDKRIEAIALYQ